MSKGVYAGVDSTARKLKKVYAGVNGVAKKLKKLYVGVNGIAHQILSGGKLEFYSTDLSLPTRATFSGPKSARAGEYLLAQANDTQDAVDGKGVEGALFSVDKNLLLEYHLYPNLSQNGGGSNGYCVDSGLATAKDSLIVVGGARYKTSWGWSSINAFCISPQLTATELENLPTSLSYTPGTELPSYAVFSGGLTANSTATDTGIYAYDENQIRNSTSALPYQTGQGKAASFANKAFFIGGASVDANAAKVIQCVDNNLIADIISHESTNGCKLVSNDHYLFHGIKTYLSMDGIFIFDDLFAVYDKSLVKIAEVDLDPPSERKVNRSYYGFKDWLIAAGGYLIASYQNSVMVDCIYYIDYLDENLILHADIEDYASINSTSSMAAGVIDDYLVLLGGHYNDSSVNYHTRTVAIYQNK